MARPRFIQIHSLASYPGTLLNRDDNGQAKRLPFGGTTRVRISSQALKRRWRFAGEADHDSAARVPYSLQTLGVPMGDRTKDLVKHSILPAALDGLPALHPVALARLTEALNVALYGKNGADPKSRQALFFGRPETAYVLQVTRRLAEAMAADTTLRADAAKEPDKAALKALDEQIKETLDPLQKNLRALAEQTRGAAGLESALFGRMVTSDPTANLDAPVHVAHAFTVHAIEQELDYVTAVDDLRQQSDDGEAGSAGIFDIEITSGLFYGYVVVDVELLVANLGGDAALAGGVVDRLVKLIACTSPGAKKGSTAPYSRAEFLLVETGDEQPRTLANAFRLAVDRRGDVFKKTIDALQSHLQALDAAYGAHTQRQQLSVTPPALDGVPVTGIDAIGQALQRAVAGE
ncbi:type I-E CRISPR-associated protein Cas7/Cse4/CasC [Rubrivivax gelatinosus]|nr:type I-E CRISPR-associated protein Cas7/Cse4/CasC [Rubrivivax gelatinosus]